MKKMKEQKGSITLLTVMTVLFFVVVLVGLYAANSNTRVSELQEIARIKEIYEEDVENIDEVYAERAARENIKEYHGEVPIPIGFYYVGGEKDTGLVISDNAADENKGTSHAVADTLQGNQFVWIPVTVTASDTKTSIASFQRTYIDFGTLADLSEYTEPYNKENVSVTNDPTGEHAEYAEMMKSVYRHKGFYVARYEAGCAVARTSNNQTTEQTVLSQKDKFVYNYVPWGASMTSTAETEGVKGAVELSRSMYPASNTNYGVVSHLMYGVQWDTMTKFVSDATHGLTDSSSWGNYKNYTGNGTYELGKLQKTGVNANWKAKNMYDIAGNIREWTMEAVWNSRRSLRGGSFADNGTTDMSIGGRYRTSPETPITIEHGFRPALYVKNN